MKKTLFTLAVLLSSALASFAQPASVPAVKSDATDVYQLYVNGGQNGFHFDGWGGARLSEETIDGKKVEKEDAFQWSGCQFTSVDVYEKKYFHLDVYPMQDMTLGVVMINSKTSNISEGNEAEKGYQVPSLTANQWNPIDIPVEYYVNKGASMAHLYQVKLISKVTTDATTADASDGFANGDGTGTFYIGNYYFYGKRTTGNVEIPFTIGTADANGFTPVRGTIAEKDLADIKALNVTALDISKAKLAEGITKIETANPNTIIAVNFTKGADGKVTSTQADQLTGSKNLVYRDTYIFPLAKLEFVDGYDVYNKFFIRTGTTGYKYTRTIGAKKYVTIMVPAIVEYNTLQTKYPALSVYNFDAVNSTATEVKFNKGTVLTPAEPHVLHNSSNADITLTVEGTGDLNLAQPASATQGTTVKFIGTYAAATADGSQYGLQGSTGAAPEFRQIVSPAVIPAFRAYITGVSASAKVFFEGETTGINSVKANGESNDGQVYNLAGQRVNAANLPAGIYVKNGKKFIKK